MTTDLDPPLDQLVDTVAELKTIVEVHTDILEALEERPERTEPGDWSWAHMSAERAAIVWDWLADFVDYINRREELGPAQRIPPCWFLHSRAVEELTALLAAWQDAYFQSGAPTSDLINYRDRWLWPTLDRLLDRNTPLRRCVDKSQHTPWTEPSDDPFLSSDGTRLDRKVALAEYIAADVSVRQGHEAGAKGS